MSLAPTRKQRPLLTVPVIYALVGSLLSIVLFFVILFFDKNPLITNKESIIIFSLIFVIFSIKEYKGYYNRGVLHFWQGILVGYFTYFLMAALYTLFVWRYLEMTDTPIFKEYIVSQTNTIIDNKENMIEHFGEEMYRQALADIKMVTPAKLVWDDLKKVLFAGIFITFIIATIMRKVPKDRG